IKYDPSGNILFAFRIGNSGADEIRGISADPSGNIYITGFFEGTVDFDPALFSSFNLSAVGRDAFVAKYSSTGNFQWAVRIGDTGSDEGNRIFADANGVYLTGFCQSAAGFYSTNSTSLTSAATQTLSNFFGAKYSQAGVVQWVVSGGGSSAEVGQNVKADNNNVFFIGNYFSDLVVYNASGAVSTTVTSPSGSQSNVFVLAYNQSGAFSWATNACSAGDDIGYGLSLDNSNVYICGGYQNQNLSLPHTINTFTLPNAGGSDIFLAAITKTTGAFSWASTSTGSGSGDEVAMAMDRTITGDLIISGAFDNTLNYVLFGGPTVVSTSGNEDVFVTAFNATGSFLWATKGGGGNVDMPYSIATNTNGSVYVGGEYATNAVFGTLTLLNFAGRNVFVGKTGCETVTNNTIVASVTVCAGSTVPTFTGSLPSGGVGAYTYQWQRSSNNFTWAPAAGTNTNL
ncbi:MAG TPA: SBBP repeat-containing protein, partial [Chitinophagaceae bacterium]|nr:SBBP repeat-containing protein [Chitinophagaceae bacterium]